MSIELAALAIREYLLDRAPERETIVLKSAQVLAVVEGLLLDQAGMEEDDSGVMPSLRKARALAMVWREEISQ